MINVYSHLRMFDEVVAHAYKVQRPKENTVTIPQEDFEKFENAKRYALALNSVGLLEEFYHRLLKEQL